MFRVQGATALCGVFQISAGSLEVSSAGDTGAELGSWARHGRCQIRDEAARPGFPLCTASAHADCCKYWLAHAAPYAF